MIKNKIYFLILLIILNGCVGASSTGVLGTGVSIATDPRTIGTQIDDNIMQKNLSAKIINMDGKYFLSVKPKVIDGRIFITGKVETIEEKLKITKLAWEIKGARSVKNDLKIKEKFNFQQSAKDLLITSQLRTAMIASKKIKSANKKTETGQAPKKTKYIAPNREIVKNIRKKITSVIRVNDLLGYIFKFKNWLDSLTNILIIYIFLI